MVLRSSQNKLFPILKPRIDQVLLSCTPLLLSPSSQQESLEA
uniref:Uncharacterized protein n=1 Tax=Rhizophora mucronata TaxID=61149 RepID=A0A2P2P0A9_RHIMU